MVRTEANGNATGRVELGSLLRIWERVPVPLKERVRDKEVFGTPRTVPF